MDISETDRAYIAGIVDGEGSIMLSQINKGKQYAPVVSVASTDRELLDWLKFTTGKGAISSKPAKKENHKDSWDWKITYNAALELLELILPYLKINRKRYRALLLVTEYKNLTPRNGKYTPELLVAKEEFLERFLAGEQHIYGGDGSGQHWIGSNYDDPTFKDNYREVEEVFKSL